jgi:FkbM family methyltransferase
MFDTRGTRCYKHNRAARQRDFSAEPQLLPQFVRRLSYSPHVRRVIRALGLQAKAQSLYCRLVQKDGAIQVSAGGVAGKFFSSSARDLRIVEASAQEPALNRLLAEVGPRDVVYDIGAHHGLYSILLARKVKHVIAFEPEQECFARLEQNVQINGLTNVTCVRRAVGDRDRQDILFLGDGVGTMNSGHLGPEWMSGGRQTIDVVAGDQFRQSQNLSVPTVMKIDVEGQEGAVLEGFRQTLSLPECRLVCCEIHPNLLPDGVTRESLMQTLGSYGFSDVQLFAHKTESHAFARKTPGNPGREE